MHDIAEEFGAQSANDEQEDVFFVRFMERQAAAGGYKVANLSTAAKFALEVTTEATDFTNVFALHQSWWYHSPALIDNLLISARAAAECSKHYDHEAAEA